MKRLSLLVLLPLLPQCQSEVKALRSETLVPFFEELGVSYTAGYVTDALWLPDEGVECVVLRERDSNDHLTDQWFVSANLGTSVSWENAESVKVPASLAARIVALARASERQRQEQRDLADAGFAAGLFIGDVERIRRAWAGDSSPAGR